MNNQDDQKDGSRGKKEDVLLPLSASEAPHDARQLSAEQIEIAIERGRADLAALEAANRHHSAISPKLRFS